MSTKCFHCFEPIPSGIDLHVTINNKQQPMCCIGCQAVAQTIVDNNLTQYYQVRTEPAQKGQPLIPEQIKKNKLLDEEVLQSEFIYQTGQYKEAILTIDGISCAACAWLIEMQITKLVGVLSISVNATTQRATVKWQDDILKLSDILNKIENIGYQALPFKASDIEIRNNRQSKTFIKRLGISGILMMQIMMIAFGLYFGVFGDMSPQSKIFLRWVSLFLALPIVFYAALPFYIGAFNALKIRHLSMDVPISIAIILAFSASAWATITQQGEVYFESVSMFTFLLLIGKFLEFRARSRAAQVSANLLKLMPITATKITQGEERLVAAKSLQLGDIVLIKPGESVPADGTILSGNSQLNEAMLSGEQLPINKTIKDSVFSGTINGDGNLTIKVKKTSNHSFLSQLIRLSEESQAHKPKLARLSDTIAQYFVAIILLSAIATALYWQQHMPEEAFWITLSVLVATCPCALSLATPTALTCATTRLNRDGIMIKSAHVMETIPKIDCFAFDKTGTLTTGEFSVSNIDIIDSDNQSTYNKENITEIAAALESYSEHPIAKPFAKYRNFNLKPENAKVYSGKGIVGCIDGITYSIGKPSWLIKALTKKPLINNYMKATCVLLSGKKLIAAFYLVDEIRSETKKVLQRLSNDNQIILLSGDNQAACEKIAFELPIQKCYGNLSASDKMNIIKQLQTKQESNNYTVAMIGDGVNDSPVFGAAHISIAMGCGADIAKSGADIILLNNNLSSINTLIHVAAKTRRIIFQNYIWALSYNIIILPLAVSGYILPYMAVIGMSASSILVISNSLRLLNTN